MSFTTKITAVLLTVTVLTAAAGCTPTPGGDPLSWLAFPLTLNGTLTQDNSEYEISLTFDTPTHGRVTINDRDYLCDNGTVTLSRNGILLPTKITPPPVKFITGALSIRPETLTETTSDGSSVTAVYNEYTVTTDKEGSIVKLQTDDITLTIEE